MKLLLADKFEKSGQIALEAAGFTLVFQPDLAGDALTEAIRTENPDALVVRGTRVSAEAIKAGSSLKLIVRAGAGYDTIDVAAASGEGVFVANCPGKNAVAVAELAFGLILACDRRIPDQAAAARAGTWNKKAFSKAPGIMGRTLGVVGLGTIGKEVITRAQAFGMNVVAWSRSLTDEGAEALGVTRAESPVALAAVADVVSVHVASKPDTKHLINDAFVSAMKPGATLVNTARGAVLDEDAVRRGIAEKGLRVGLDVFADEPSGGTGEITNAILQDEGVYGTHHVGASTDQAQEAIANEAVRVITTFQRTGEVPNCLNRAKETTASCAITVRHRNRPGVLANVFRVLSEAGINVEEMQNILLDGGEAACAIIPVAGKPDVAAIAASSPHILSVELGEGA